MIVIGWKITTVDLLGETESLFIPCLTWQEQDKRPEDEPQFGEHGFDASDFADPTIYKSVFIEPIFD